MLFWIFVIAGIVWLDQLSKWLVITYLPDGGVYCIDGVLRFTYVENTGAAFGMLSDSRWIFIALSSIALILLAVYLFYKKPQSRLARCAMAFIIGGGVGNMIDRILLGYVIDFIDFCAFPKIWMWVFNIADSFVCIGAGLLMLYLVVSMVNDVQAEKAVKAAGIVTGGDNTDSADKDVTGTQDETNNQSHTDSADKDTYKTQNETEKDENNHSDC